MARRVPIVTLVALVSGCAAIYSYGDYERRGDDGGTKPDASGAKGGAGISGAGGFGSAGGGSGGVAASGGTGAVAASGGIAGAGGSGGVAGGGGALPTDAQTPNACQASCVGKCGATTDSCGNALACGACIFTTSCSSGVCIDVVELVCAPNDCTFGFTELTTVSTTICGAGTCPTTPTGKICAKQAFLETSGVQSSCIKGHEGLEVLDCVSAESYLVCVKD